MDPVEVFAIVGACGPERRLYAERLSELAGLPLVPASLLERSADPVDTATTAARHANDGAGVVVEFPALVPAPAIVARLADPEEDTRLVGLVCVADVAHLLQDLSSEDFIVPIGAASRLPSNHVARASIAMQQLEFASTIVLVGWEPLATPQLAMLMALVSMLNPGARLRLDRGAPDAAPERSAYSQQQERAGWMAVLAEGADPHFTDPRITAFRYEQLRPFHPQRLSELLLRRFDTGEFGRIVRSAGFCRLATSAQVTLHWDQVGRTIGFHAASLGDGSPGSADSAGCADEELLAFGQDLAFIGIDLDRVALTEALDRAALSDDELTAGPSAWARYPDPFPRWDAAEDRA